MQLNILEGIMGGISIFYCFIFLLGPLLFSTEINAGPKVFITTVIEKNSRRIDLRWVRTEQYLANENLRVWETGIIGLFKHNKHLAEELGTIEAYHDLDQSSAILFFKKFNLIFGTIGDDYDIMGLPINKLCYDHYVGQSPYIHDMNKSDSVPPCSRVFLRSFSDPVDLSQDIQQPSCSHWHKRPHNEDEYYSNLLSEKRPRFDENVSVQKKTHLGDFYPEILILVNHEMMKICHNMKTAYIIILMYMNAISMLFAKLKDHVNIHINIASIIFEKQPGAFPFSSSMFISAKSNDDYTDLLFNAINEYININSNSYRKINSRIFHEDAFDFFLFMTPDLRPSSIINDVFRGFSTEILNILNQRNEVHLHIQKKQLGVIVPPSNMLENYVDVARQIAHLMRVENDGEEPHFIMQNNKFNHYCSDCLEWSPKSVESFRKFFRQDTNRCFLMNKPRSLYEFDKPRITLTPKQQCNCYNHEILSLHAETLILTPSRHGCQTHLPCTQSVTREITFITNVPPPIEGTPCNVGKVCWNKKCVSFNN